MFLVKQIQNNGRVATDCRETSDFAHLAHDNKWEEHNEPIRNRDKSMQAAQKPGNWRKRRENAYELSAIDRNFAYD